jgi:anthranilate phosphoribosyltransferase
MNTQKKANLYKGSMTGDEAREKLQRTAERLGLTHVTFTPGRGLDVGSMTAHFQYNSTRIERTCATQPSLDANTACLALWLEDRARNLERGIETFAEAFADSMVQATNDNAAQYSIARANYYEGSKSVEECIDVFRSAFGRLDVPERDVKVTWDTDANWARLRMRLPSGAIVEKISRAQKTSLANLAVLALWIQSRARNWERGIESLDLDRVFAGNLLPAKVA